MLRSLFVFCLFSAYGILNQAYAMEPNDIEKGIILQNPDLLPKVVALSNENTRKIDQMTIAFEHMSDGLKSHLNEQEAAFKDKIDNVTMTAEANKQMIDLYFTVVSMFVGVVLALVAIVFGFGAYRVIVDNRRLVEHVNKLVDEQFGKWLEDRQKVFNEKLENLHTSCQWFMEDLVYFHYLKKVVSSGKAKADDIFPLLTPLIARPRGLYKPLFKKLQESNIHPDITSKAAEGLKRLQDSQLTI